MTLKYLGVRLVVLVNCWLCLPAFAQTDGSVQLEARVLDYTGTSGPDHWTVVWVTTGSGTFIKTLWRQGPTITSSHWNNHCRTWYTAKGANNAFDGYSSATARSYNPPNSPVVLSWNCRDAANALVADGDYKFWVQYAEDSGQGPYTTSGLLWTKGTAGITNTYPNQGANFSGMKVTWIPSAPPPVAPTITSPAPPGTGTVGVAYQHTVTATGTDPITFSASGLPPGLSISATGTLSGTPTTAGTFPGQITATNGVPPNATQAFSIVISAPTLTITSAALESGNLVLRGSGAPNGTFVVRSTTDVGQPVQSWTQIGTGTVDAGGNFSFSTPFEGTTPRRYFRLQTP